MTRQITRKWGFRAIAIAQIAGGLLGIGSITDAVWLSIAAGELPILSFLLFLIVASYFLWGIFAGTILLESHGNRHRSSIAFQAVQVPILVAPGLTFHVGVGLYIFLIVGEIEQSSNPIAVLARFGTDWRISFLGNQDTCALGVNMFSLLAVLFLIAFRQDTPQSPCDDG